MSAAFSLSNSVASGAFFWAFNGVGLALLIPNAQSLIADYYKPVSRGAAFGALYLTGALGGMAGGLFATNIGHVRPFGVEGWRIAFLSVDPRYKIEEPQYAQDPDIFKERPISMSRMAADVGSVLAVPSFVLIVVQGIIGYVFINKMNLLKVVVSYLLHFLGWQKSNLFNGAAT